MLKKILIWVGIIILIHQVVITYKYYTDEPIAITETKVESTKQVNTQLKQKIEKKEELTRKDIVYLTNCYNNPYTVKGNIQGNYLYVDITDGCKSTQARFTIKVKDTKYHIIQAGVIFRYQADISYEISYLYDFALIAIGGGIIIDRENPGCKIIAQIRI